MIDDAAPIDDAPHPPQRSADLVVPEPVRWAVSPRQWAGIGAARARLVELASHPIVVATATATATVGTGVVVSALRHALRNGSGNGAATPVTVTINVMHQ